MSSTTVSLFRLRVLADADPDAIARVIERFQNLNVLPRRVIAEFGTDETVRIQVDICGLSEHQLKVIAAKIGAATSIVSAHWHRLQRVWPFEGRDASQDARNPKALNAADQWARGRAS